MITIKFKIKEIVKEIKNHTGLNTILFPIRDRNIYGTNCIWSDEIWVTSSKVNSSKPNRPIESLTIDKNKIVINLKSLNGFNYPPTPLTDITNEAALNNIYNYLDKLNQDKDLMMAADQGNKYGFFGAVKENTETIKIFLRSLFEAYQKNGKLKLNITIPNPNFDYNVNHGWLKNNLVDILYLFEETNEDVLKISDGYALNIAYMVYHTRPGDDTVYTTSWNEINDIPFNELYAVLAKKYPDIANANKYGFFGMKKENIILYENFDYQIFE